MKLPILHFLLIFASSIIYGQSGSNDPSFNSLFNESAFGADNDVFSINQQQDSKLIVAGAFTTFNGQNQNHITRLNINGRIDTSFHAGIDGNVYSSVFQSNGKIIIGGSFNFVNGIAQTKLARLNTDGSLDLSFNVGFGPDTSVRAIALQNDGKLIVAGSFNSINGVGLSKIARLNEDGSIDPTFNQLNSINNQVKCIAIQSDGKIIIGGQFTVVNGVVCNRLARLNTDGSLDTSFDMTVGFSNYPVYDVDVQADGKILVGGNFDGAMGSFVNCLVRLEADGQYDYSFASNVSGYSSVYSIDVQSDQSIVIGGSFYYVNGTTWNGIAKVNALGALDTTFGVEQGTDDFVWKTFTQNDGKIAICGSFSKIYGQQKSNFGRLNSDGSLDVDFQPLMGIDNVVYYSFAQADGKTIISGDFNEVNGSVHKSIVRFNGNGTVDQTFNPIVNGIVNSISELSNGKILIGGGFTLVNGITRNSVAILNQDGSLEATFDPQLPTYTNTTNVANEQLDGKILIGGQYYLQNGALQNLIFRLNPDGSFDQSYNLTILPANITGVSGYVKAIAIQPDGKAIIAGGFAVVNSANVAHIARINLDGTQDLTFDSGLAYEGGNGITLQKSLQILPNGKILIVGDFTSFDGVSRKNIVRLESDGSVDFTFNPGNGTDGPILALTILPDNKLLLGGNFTTYNGNSVLGLTRIQSNGAYDSSFDSGLGVEGGSVWTSALQPDGKIIIAGNFTGYNGAQRLRIARVLNDIAAYSNAQVQIFTTPTSLIECNGASFISVDQSGMYQFDIGNGNSVTGMEYMLFDSLCAGIYTLTLTDQNNQINVQDFVISSDSNYFYNPPFTPQDTITDTLSVLVANCTIDYATIYDVSVGNMTMLGVDSLLVEWVILDSANSTTIPVIYILNSLNGNVLIQLQLYCPNKSIGKYAVATDGVRILNGEVNTLSNHEMDLESLDVFPIPTSNAVTIKFESPSAKLNVFDSQGKLIQQHSITSGSNIDLSKVESGIYFFELTTDKGKVIKRVVKN